MNQPCLVEQAKRVEQLLGEYTHQSGAKSTELVLLDKFVQVYAQQLENQT